MSSRRTTPRDAPSERKKVGISFAFDIAAWNAAMARETPPAAARPVSVGAPGDYDPSQGGGGLQGFFPSMLLDSDRFERYFVAIESAIEEFKRNEGRAPIVLDVGCGTGVLTACALVAGAEKVFAVDVDEKHIDNLLGRFAKFPRYLRKLECILANADEIGLPSGLKKEGYDMIVSEMLGTFSNSESARKYLQKYAEGMKVHPSENVYMIPQKVVQTFRKLDMKGKHQGQAHFPRLNYTYFPTNLTNCLFEEEHMAYHERAREIIVRTDNFMGRTPMTTHIEHGELKAGWHIAEWKAQLWGEKITLENTLRWYQGYDGDKHSKYARAQAWGLMVVVVKKKEVAEFGEALYKRYAEVRRGLDKYLQKKGNYDQDHETKPMLFHGEEKLQPCDIVEFELMENHSKQVMNDSGYMRHYETLHNTIPSLPNGGQMPGPPGQFHYFELSLHPKTLQVGALQKSCGQEPEFPLELIYNCTLHDIVEKIKEASGKPGTNGWILTLPHLACLPLVATPEDQLPKHLSTNTTLLAMADPAKNLLTNEVLTVGAALRLQNSN